MAEQSPQDEAKVSSRKRARRIVALIVVVWTVLVGSSLAWNLHQVHRHVDESAIFQARALTDKDVLYRRWNNMFGGVYVKTANGAEPNPFMADHPERDLKVRDGRMLTLVNPPFMTRQVYELQEEYLGIPGRITSLDPVNPGNAPDRWEQTMLTRFKDGQPEGISFQKHQGMESLRYMQPLILEEGCLDCHMGTKEDVGDVRGALSITIPMAPFHAGAQLRSASLAGTHLLIWVAGTLCMLWAYRRYSTALGLRLAAESDLRAAMASAEQANRSKGELLASVSHEIRTPLGSILGMTDLLLEGPLRSEQRSTLISMKDSSESLGRLVNDILDFSKIEAGMLDFEKIPFSPVPEVENVLEMLALKAHQKGVELIFDPASDLPAQVLGDPLRLRQVVMNLVDNAIKFTDRGEVVVAIEKAEQGAAASGAGLLFRVTDTGIGIPEEKIDGLFQHYHQGAPGTSRRYGGTGLGLAISQQLVQRMGGRIEIDSRPGRGSTFFFNARFDLPQTTGDADMPSVSSSRRKILLGMANHRAQGKASPAPARILVQKETPRLCRGT